MGDLKESNYALRNGPLRLDAESVKAVAGKPDDAKHTFWGRADQREIFDLQSVHCHAGLRILFPLRPSAVARLAHLLVFLG